MLKSKKLQASPASVMHMQVSDPWCPPSGVQLIIVSASTHAHSSLLVWRKSLLVNLLRRSTRTCRGSPGFGAAVTIIGAG
jgi:hypothetical protein